MKQKRAAVQTIQCPKCKAEIPLTDALTRQIEENVRHEFDLQLAKKDDEAKAALKAKDAEYKKQLDADRVRLAREAGRTVGLELRDLKAEIAEKDAKLQAANENELKLRKRGRELEQREKDIELDVQRKIDDERKKIGGEAKKEAEEEYRLKLREKEVAIDGMKKTIDELKRKSEQGSVQLQGEAQEIELDDLLSSAFKYDVIERIGKGKDGADVLQEVQNNAGRACGSILFESKRTKNWSEGWIEKAKKDRLEAKSDIVVIVTQAMPKDVSRIGLRDGVWVCDLQSVIGLATALREGILRLSEANTALAGKTEKMELVYKYLCSPEFEQRIQSIVDAFTSMRDGLETEKRAMNRIWAQREKEIDKVLVNTAGMYGDLKGIIGRSLPVVRTLELPAGDDALTEGNQAA